MYAILRRELAAWYGSPLAWLLLAVLVFGSAYLFLMHLETYLQLQDKLRELTNPPGATRFLLPRTLVGVSLFFIAITPLLSMRLIAGERRDGTWRLLQAAPISDTSIIIGKYLALLLVLTGYLFFVALMPVSMLLFTRVDLGATFAALLGIWLLASGCSAIGLLMSCLSANPLIAAIISFGILLFLWLLSFHDQQATQLTQYLALPNHLSRFLSGLIDTRDLAYYLILASGCIAFSVLRLRALRHQP